MLGRTHTRRRIATGLALATALVLVAVPSALGGGFDGRSPDTRDAAVAAHAQSTQVADGRSPDTRDFAALAHAPVVTVVESPGFQWDDFGIGIAAALGAVLILFASTKLLTGREGRKADPVATA